MSCSRCLLYILFLTLSSHIVRTVPPDYCLSPLNRSDCNMAPISVYSYYKPGSRCDRETWRGCPTANKFDNEYLCSLNCIFRMRQDDPVDFDPCNIPLNQRICGEQKFVITHEKGYCKRALWGGCPTYNIFDDVQKCVEACNGIPLEELVKTPPTETLSLEKLDELLKVLIENFRTTTEQETETESTTETDSDTESISTEETTTVETTTEETTTDLTTTDLTTTDETTTDETTTDETTTDVTTTDVTTTDVTTTDFETSGEISGEGTDTAKQGDDKSTVEV